MSTSLNIFYNETWSVLDGVFFTRYYWPTLYSVAGSCISKCRVITITNVFSKCLHQFSLYFAYV